jgi:serine/threonine protein phosphatase 1
MVMQMWTEWRPFPGRLPEEQIFVIGDVHGRGCALEGALRTIAEVPRAAPLRRLVSLGDLIDRGPANLYAIDAVTAGRETALVDRVDLLPGNHELMLLDAIDDPSSASFYARVGGLAVIDELDPNGVAKTNQAVSDLLRDGVPGAFLIRMRTGPSHLRIGDLILVHAGLYPTRDETLQARFLTQGRDASLSEHWAWIRHPFLDWTGGWDEDRHVVVMHGHTSAVERPVHPDTFFAAADLTAKHRRVCLDAGAAGCEQVGFAELRGGADPVYRIGMVRCCPTLEED